jgi:hypothetical protein
MTVQVEQAIDGGHHHDVSGTVVQVLIGLVYARSGDTGVAQALALADDGRSFAALADAASWSSLPEAVALLNAAALVSGDGAVGLHVGERLLSHPDGTDFVERLAALGSPVEVFKHIGAIIDHFETLSVTAPLEIAADHALVEVSPRRDETRHPHLCEMTRGLLSRVPTLFGRGPALISENECSARGGRFCLYAVSWAEESGVSDDPTDAVRSPRVPPTGPKGPEGLLDKGGDGGRVPRDRDDPGGGWTAPADRTGLSLLPTTPDAVEAGAADLRDERDRLRSIVEGATATANELLHGDVDSLLAEIADRADAAVGTERFLLMLRVRPWPRTRPSPWRPSCGAGSPPMTATHG